MINNITLEVGLSDYNNAKAEFLSEYFLEQVESGQMTFFQALLAQKKVRKAADRAREDNQDNAPAAYAKIDNARQKAVLLIENNPYCGRDLDKHNA